MKKIVIFVCVIITIVGSVFSPSAFAEGSEETAPVYAEDLNDGVYDIEVDSSSSMFRIIDCKLNVQGDEMTAIMTLSGVGYEKLFMGTSDEALMSGDESYIYFEENPEGKYTYTVEIEALNVETDCAAWSFKKEKWYDRVLVFRSDSLDESAFKHDPNALVIIIPSVALFLAAVIIIAVIISKKHRRSGDA